MNEKRYEYAISCVEEYLDDLGVQVKYRDDIVDSFCDLYWYEIHIPSKSDAESKLFSLLHEGGHFLIEADEKYLPLKGDCVDVIINETLAWEAGSDIASTCSIEIDKERYYEVTKESIEKYVDLCIQKKGTDD
tara:strand:- start:25604 stop:26002 length:399 start_codon:yes stop_codon:yes gene_type:complete